MIYFSKGEEVMKKLVTILLVLAISMTVMPNVNLHNSQAAITSPQSISGLKAWFDATDLSLNDGDSISKWENKVGDSNFDAIQTDAGKQPKFVASGINGKEGVRLSDETFLQLANQFDLNDMSIFVVAKFDSMEGGGDDNQIFSKLSNSDPWDHNWYFNINNKKFNFGWKDAETWRDYPGSNNGIAVDTNYILSGIKRQDKGLLYLNGEKLGETQGNTGNPAALHNAQPIYIGGSGVGKSMDGIISEVVVFDRGLTDTEIEDVNAYLNEKWKINIGDGVEGMIMIDGKPIRAFSKSTLNYKHTLAKGRTEIPVVTADFSGANVTVTQADSVDGMAKVAVEIEGVTKEYTVNFSVFDKDILDLKQPEVEQVEVLEGFWKEKLDLFSTTTVNYVFDRFEERGTLKNFEKIGTENARPEGSTDPWNDGLLFETIRGASDFLRANRDAELEAKIDEYIDMVYAASLKSENGYLSTWAMMEKPGQYFDATGDARWYHDAYNFGCMTEAAVHYYKATGKTKLLFVSTRFAEFIVENYGYGTREDGSPKINMVPSHQGPEEMLLKLYELYKDNPDLKNDIESYSSTYPLNIKEDEYADLVKFWIENRGNADGRVNGITYGEYAQDHARFYEQNRGIGHAVRANLFYTGMAAAGREFDDYTYLSTANEIWENIVNKQMYITGGVGARQEDEAYGEFYELPNTGYCETCAQVAMGFFSEELSLVYGESKYADLIEKYIYNGVLGCIGEDGKSFYYQQPLSMINNERWDWIDHTPCCPPMFLKFYSEMPTYIYSYNADSVYVNQFISSKLTLDSGIIIAQETQMPWGGTSSIKVEGGDTNLYIRIPNWTNQEDFVVKKNNQKIDYVIVDGYAKVSAEENSVVEVSIPLEARREYSAPEVTYNEGKVALAYGPVIYSVEQVDNRFVPYFSTKNGNFGVPVDAELKAQYDENLLNGIVSIEFEGEYYDSKGVKQTGTMIAIPSYKRSNREVATSYVWVDEEVKPLSINNKSWMAKALDSTSDIGNSASAAFDGKMSTSWISGSPDTPQVIMCDLDEVNHIKEVAISFGSSQGWKYSVLTSKDGREWGVFFNNSENESVEEEFSNKGDASARYVAVRVHEIPENGYVEIKEIKVLGEDADKNLAKRTLCAATSTLNNGMSVFAMLDGNDETRYCPSGVQKPISLLMDMGEVAEVTGMEILFEKPSEWSFEIEISDDGKTFTQYHKETWKMTDYGIVKGIDKTAQGRYIKLTITGTTDGVWGSLWEFDVKTKESTRDIFKEVIEAQGNSIDGNEDIDENDNENPDNPKTNDKMRGVLFALAVLGLIALGCGAFRLNKKKATDKK